ncbi:DISARM system phospholipase D-like protein DrmC [Streptacidiphilus sp. ASG 303]|uniref:DISARM system phospholipase D-like protein DrmC n=1 Tax=Streptacidiphilus sp. ASG 303 TaxID=2896847 RepID=UPI001E648E01|nr:DISARM system phospholipase D-like protein DrmC [Streptacidiphilus sp. ASG 303]MCD0485982.1 DISARM system phospholipase D-like protein DrmC [Streptacidiphilus sp. ASG 303]
MSRRAFEAAAAAAAAALGPVQTRSLAGLLARGRSRESVLGAVQVAAALPAVAGLLDAADADGVTSYEAAAYLRGFTAAWTQQRDRVEVRTVWSGPSSRGVPVRATAQVLVQVVNDAREEILAMTYSARPFPPLIRALRAATARDVRVDIVVETRLGAAGLLDGPEPAEAFRQVPGVQLWHWPAGERTVPGARQHAKVAVADRRVLFLGSANLTSAGARRNIEAGVVVRGGSVPQRAAEHIRELQRVGVLKPLG